MNWINRRKLPATEAIKHNGSPCLSSESLWNAPYSTFNTALNRQIDLDILSKINRKPIHNGFPFPKKNSSKQLASAMTRLHLNPTNCHGII